MFRLGVFAGKTQGPYHEEFPVGIVVRVAERQALEEFAQVWKYHHPLQPHQLEFAGCIAQVATIDFYHGGDELYSLEGIPGTWHEVCLSLASDG
jgi:hypothetical protein